jgi:hypothetical protein
MATPTLKGNTCSSRAQRAALVLRSACARPRSRRCRHRRQDRGGQRQAAGHDLHRRQRDRGSGRVEFTTSGSSLSCLASAESRFIGRSIPARSRSRRHVGVHEERLRITKLGLSRFSSRLIERFDQCAHMTRPAGALQGDQRSEGAAPFVGSRCRDACI